ncbi:MAG: CPBP family intramembrane metalloprotease [Acidobacteriota bacterium]|nr:CPBP family intramembrane metalloprotease [Acidobacteriota bacterium]
MGALLRTAGPPVLAVLTAFLVDHLCARRGLLPPGFRVSDSPGALSAAALRRATALLVVAGALWLGVFAPLGSLGVESVFDPTGIKAPQLFLLHGLLLAAVGSWFLLGFGAGGSGTGPRHQFGLRARRVDVELGIGVVAGLVAWMAVITTMVLTGLGLWALGGRDLLPESAPPLVPWLAGLPLLLRLGVSVSAGFAEEVFFRGFLQPRAGVLLSTVLFVLAHLSYEQPFMLLGVALLSLIFGALVLWRQSVWAAISAHATFDAIQLTIMIPWALEHLDDGRLPLAATLLLTPH